MKRYFKFGLAILMAFVMAFAFAACGEKEETTNTVEGDVISCDDGYLEIKTNANEELSFNIENATLECEAVILKGDKATIEYTGEIKDGSTDECKVTNVTIVSGEEKTEEAYDEAEEEADKLEDKAVTTNVNETVWCNHNGVNVREGSSIDTKILGKLSKGDSVTRVAVISNGWSIIKYKNSNAYVSSQYLSTKKVEKTTTKKTDTTTKKTDDTTKKEEKKEDPEPVVVKTVTMVGTVKSVEDGILIMDTAVGNEFRFEIGTAVVYRSLDVGAAITVEFEGDEADPGKLLKVY